MISVSDWSKAYLTRNPFAATPPSPGEEIVWADMARERQEIESRIRDSLKTRPSRLFLVWGYWGAGKTHAARYFSQKEVLSRFSSEIDVPEPLSLVVKLPIGSKSVINSVYRSIVESLGLYRIGKELSEVKARMGGGFREQVRHFVESAELQQAVLMLLDSDIRDDPEEWNALRRYLLLDANVKELRTLGLARRLDEPDDVRKILSCILNLLVYRPEGNNALYSEVIIWFDEIEEVLSLSGREQDMFSTFLRDLTDYVPVDLTMFMNFTPRPGEGVEDLSIYLNPAVKSRVQESIRFEFLSGDGIKEYITDILNFSKNRPNELKEKSPDKFYPFEEQSIQKLSELLGEKATPRIVNQACSILIEEAFNENIIDGPGGRITREMINDKEGHISSIGESG